MLAGFLSLGSAFSYYQSAIGRTYNTLSSFDTLTITPPTTDNGVMLISDEGLGNSVDIKVTDSYGNIRNYTVSSFNTIPAIHIKDAKKVFVDANSLVHITSWILPDDVCDGGNNILVSSQESYTLSGSTFGDIDTDACVFSTFDSLAKVKYQIKSDAQAEIYESTSTSPVFKYTNTGSESKFNSVGNSFVRFKGPGFSDVTLLGQPSILSTKYVTGTTCGSFSFSRPKDTSKVIQYGDEGFGILFTTCGGIILDGLAGWAIGVIVGVVVLAIILFIVFWVCCCGCCCAACSACGSCFHSSSTTVVYADSQNSQPLVNTPSYVYSAPPTQGQYGYGA